MVYIYGTTDKICFLCNGIFQHQIKYRRGIYGLQEVEIVVNCPTCKKLLNKKDRLKSQLTSIEWEIFCLGGMLI